MDINARLEKLERENRRMKKLGIVTAVILSALIICDKPDHPASSME